MPVQTLKTLPFDRSLFAPGDRVVAAVSGGADSVAMLRALHAEASKLGIGLSVVHVHHGLRGSDADADAAFVQGLAVELDLPVQVHHADVPARIARTGEGIEEAAREERYAFFHSLLATGADSIATAHTADDQTETVLMKLLRGAWTAGLGGIHPAVEVQRSGGRHGRIVRPLLSVRRSAVEEYLQALGQAWREDASNADPAFTRNRMRHEILPLLRSENPSLDDTLAQTAELAREEEARWQVELERLLPHLLLPGKPVRGGGRAVGSGSESATYAIELERLRALDPALRRRVLRAAAEKFGVSLSFAETDRLLALCGFRADPTVPSKAGSVLKLAHGMRAERSLRELRLNRQPV